ncbi:hypothetical protein [Kytococcus sedentarius]|uniref:hypothetical protein n=1 Tax=Kytococcus sedentarius TaxID=1276 RepID=UPI00384ED0BC
MRAAAEKRLLQGELEAEEVLVRELAQNSWDARESRVRTVEFELRVRRLAPATRRAMRRVLSGPPRESIRLDEWLAHGDGEVLEVSDRGTTGLRGPVRVGATNGSGTPTNFVDFVFSVGATKPSGGVSGGTYGFGKSAAYAFSEVGTVIVWTRVRLENGSFEERLIGSAIGDAFDHGGRRHTGRHWWGSVVREGGEAWVEPLVGQVAERTARSWFDHHFEGEETGTSLLILAPLRSGGGNPATGGRLEDRLRRAITTNLWPKVLPAQGADHAPMSIMVHGPDGSVALQDELKGPVFTALEACLQAVRAPTGEVDEQVVLKPLVHKGRHRVVGHVALARVLGAGARTAVEAGIVDRVTYMRRDAELVVCYDKHRPAENEMFPWVGVMQPVAERDADFAAAEPAAHNQWYPKQVADPEARSYVNVALTRVGEEVSEFLGLRKDPSRSLLDTAAARLGDGLAGMFTGLAGGAATHSRATPSGGGGRGGRAGARLVVGEVERRRAGEAMLLALPVLFEGEVTEPHVARATVSVAVDGGPGLEDPRAVIVGWKVAERVVPGNELEVDAGGTRPLGHLMIKSAASVVPQLDLALVKGGTA